MFASQTTYIIYDGECPFCSQYVKLLRLRESVGQIELVDARQTHPAIDYVERAGVVLNNEMALVHRGEIYSGPECINRLALLSTRSGLFNRLNALAFSSAGVSKVTYPVLRSCRNLALRLLRREQLRTTQTPN